MTCDISGVSSRGFPAIGIAACPSASSLKASRGRGTFQLISSPPFQIQVFAKITCRQAGPDRKAVAVPASLMRAALFSSWTEECPLACGLTCAAAFHTLSHRAGDVTASSSWCYSGSEGLRAGMAVRTPGV